MEDDPNVILLRPVNGYWATKRIGDEREDAARDPRIKRETILSIVERKEEQNEEMCTCDDDDDDDAYGCEHCDWLFDSLMFILKNHLDCGDPLRERCK